jgi:hypothetical protein
MPNMPEADSAWIRFAPVAGLEDPQRHQRVGGGRLPDDEAGQQGQRQQAEGDGPVSGPAQLGGRLDDGEHADHQRGGDQDSTGNVGTTADSETLVLLDQLDGQGRGDDADRQVDEEDPVPVDRLGQHPTGEQADRAAGRGDERVDADRLGLLPRFGEQRHDHAQDHRGGQRAADALDEAGRDQHLLGPGQTAPDGGGGEE